LAIFSTAGVYVIVDADRAGKALLTLIIDDLDQHVAALGERGFIPEEAEDVPGKYRKVIFRDPEGNTIALVRSSQWRASPRLRVLPRYLQHWRFVLSRQRSFAARSS